MSADRSTTGTVDAKRLWAGGVATAVVAALTAVVGLLVVRNLLNIPVLTSAVEFGRSQLTTLAGYGVIASLMATALVHLLLLTTPRAISFFGAICLLASIAAALWPFTLDATLASKIGSGLLYFVIGMAILSLLSGVGAASFQARTPGVR